MWKGRGELRTSVLASTITWPTHQVSLTLLTKMPAKAPTCFNFFNFHPVSTKYSMNLEHIILTKTHVFCFWNCYFSAGKLRHKLAAKKLTFGYIGNFTHLFDRRHWNSIKTEVCFEIELFVANSKISGLKFLKIVDFLPFWATKWLFFRPLYRYIFAKNGRI